MLGGAILVISLAAATISFGLAYSDAKEFQDTTLQQIAAVTDDWNLKDQRRTDSSADATNGSDSDAEDQVMVMVLPSGTASTPAVWLPTELLPGFHDVNTKDGSWRVFVRRTSKGEHIAVGQASEVREDMAIDSALRTLIPLLLLLPILIWLIIRIVRSEIAPINQLTNTLDAQSAARPHPLSDDDLPREITPFVHAINRLLARVNALMDQQRRFIADAAHELRSPLTALSIQAQNLKHAGSLDTMRERVIPLQGGIERARHLTEQLLSLARTQAGAAGDTVGDISTMTRELIAEYLPLAEAKRIDLGLEETAPIPAQAISEALQLILKNALENALKYTPNGGKVTVRLLADIDSAVIEVADNGPGIPASERERVFDAFYRMPGTAGEGSGLGLAIAHKAALALGGVVSLHERQYGTGVVFRYRQQFER